MLEEINEKTQYLDKQVYNTLIYQTFGSVATLMTAKEGDFISMSNIQDTYCSPTKDSPSSIDCK